MRNAKKVIFSLFATVALIAPHLGFAATLDDIQAQIQSIVNQINKIQMQLVELGQNPPRAALAETKTTLLPEKIDIKSASVDDISSLINIVGDILKKLR